MLKHLLPIIILKRLTLGRQIFPVLLHTSQQAKFTAIWAAPQSHPISATFRQICVCTTEQAHQPKLSDLSDVSFFLTIISPCHGASYQSSTPVFCIDWRLCLQLKYFFHFETFQIPNFREPFRMPGPGYWLEPHPWGCLEHPWSLRSGTLRAQEPASLHFVRIVSFHKISSFSLFSQPLSFQLWVCPSRGTMLSEFNRFELALPLLLPKEHLPSQAGCTHQPH